MLFKFFSRETLLKNLRGRPGEEEQDEITFFGRGVLWSCKNTFLFVRFQSSTGKIDNWQKKNVFEYVYVLCIM